MTIQEPQNIARVLALVAEPAWADSLARTVAVLGNAFYRARGHGDLDPGAMGAVADILVLGLDPRNGDDALMAAESLLRRRRIPVIVLLPSAEPDLVLRAGRLRPAACLVAPFSEPQLSAAIILAGQQGGDPECAAADRGLESGHERGFIESILNALPAHVAVLEPDGSIVAANTAWKRFSGVSEAGSEAPKPIVPVGADRDQAEIAAAGIRRVFRREAGSFEMEYKSRSPKGGRWFSLAAAPMDQETGRVVVACWDATRLKAGEEQARLALKEKEILLREVHHRVKNNMQVISSLLSLQARCMSDPDVRAAFADSQQRILAMSLIHETLYTSGQMACIDFDRYLHRLVSSLRQSYGSNRPGIRLDLTVKDVNMSLDKAVPCGLVVNELITNAMKYAFPQGRKGTISIEAGMLMDGRVRLSVADDGVGLPDDYGTRQLGSLGLPMVLALVEGQLGGCIKRHSSPGTRFVITFEPEKRGGNPT